MNEIWRDCQIHPDVECFETYNPDTYETTYRDCEVKL
jgi:hypothetical protein